MEIISHALPVSRSQSREGRRKSPRQKFQRMVIEEQSGSLDKNWNSVWSQHLEEYYQGAPRAGLWLERQFPLEGKRVLEIAAGSCRDSLYLAEQGYDVTATDYLPELVEQVALRHQNSTLKFDCQNAFSFQLEDGAFDITYHNGFWVNFESDDTLCELLTEQTRITRECLVMLLHNKRNPRLKRLFARRAVEDRMYRIRFFAPEDLIALIERSGLSFRHVEFRKFGGLVDGFHRRHLFGVQNPFAQMMESVVPHLYALQPWWMVERVACVLWR